MKGNKTIICFPRKYSQKFRDQLTNTVKFKEINFLALENLLQIKAFDRPN